MLGKERIAFCWLSLDARHSLDLPRRPNEASLLVEIIHQPARKGFHFLVSHDLSPRIGQLYCGALFLCWFETETAYYSEAVENAGLRKKKKRKDKVNKSRQGERNRTKVEGAREDESACPAAPSLGSP